MMDGKSASTNKEQTKTKVTIAKTPIVADDGRPSGADVFFRLLEDNVVVSTASSFCICAISSCTCSSVFTVLLHGQQDECVEDVAEDDDDVVEDDVAAFDVDDVSSCVVAKGTVVSVSVEYVDTVREVLFIEVVGEEVWTEMLSCNVVDGIVMLFCDVILRNIVLSCDVVVIAVLSCNVVIGIVVFTCNIVGFVTLSCNVVVVISVDVGNSVVVMSSHGYSKLEKFW